MPVFPLLHCWIDNYVVWKEATSYTEVGDELESVLITGADGFLGRNLVRSLLDMDIEVYAVVYPGNNVYQEYANEKLHVLELDLNTILEYKFDSQKKIDVMYHFAWMGVSPELRDNLDVQMSNINMTMSCLKFASAIGIKKVILPGSTNEYLYYGKPLNKDAVPSPNNAYGAVKVALRYLCSEFARKNGMEFIYAILTGIYAADRQDNNVIFYTIKKLLNGEKPSLTKLEQLWDYVYIDDVIDALTSIGYRGKNGAVYAVGHGDNWPLAQYIRIIHEKIDPMLPLGIGEVPYTGDVLPSSCIDLTDLERDTGFRPRVSFEQGITRVIDRVRKDIGNRQ